MQLKNIVPIDSKSSTPNIRVNYTVTDKADGTRKLLYIADDRKIYLIDMNMNVQFTGVETENDDLKETILDGEHILHNKLGQYINLYAAFDVYFANGNDVRTAAFIPIIEAESKETESKETESKETERKKAESKITRLQILTNIISNLNIKGVAGAKQLIRINKKAFYQTTPEETIFQACRKVLQNEEDGLFEYNTDGLIFTPADLGVGLKKRGEQPVSRKITWDYSFKWKPPIHNTIDFLVSVVKTKSGSEDIKNIFQRGKDMVTSSQLTQYKTLVLRVGYDEKRHGYLNPCQMVINGDKPTQANSSSTDSSYRPVQFYPSNPADKDAGICNIMLSHGEGNRKLMLAENDDVIEDNMIVEFRYDPTQKAKWRWIPIRVRYDKTAELRGGGRNFGNAYHVADSNWHTLHNPVTALMLKSGQNIPDELDDADVYYNKKSGANATQALRNFHNLYIKKKLITSVSKPDDTLIDLAVGKGGDISKCVSAKLMFVFGVDVSRDNIENKIDGACVRYLNQKKRFSTIPIALFVQGNSILNIKSGEAIVGDSNKNITKAIFGTGARDKKVLGEVPYNMYGEGENGFNVCSIQFAIHYMWESLETLHGFLRNVSETTKVGGHFIGTSYNGEAIFRKLASKKINESVTIMENNEKF